VVQEKEEGWLFHPKIIQRNINISYIDKYIVEYMSILIIWMCYSKTEYLTKKNGLLNFQLIS
jgi:hypothetical protein